MTAAKMLRILQAMGENGPYYIGAANGEICFNFMTQPSRVTHLYLMDAGFVLTEVGDYAYRPGK